MRLRFGPRLTPDRFKAAFTAPEGWGTFSQRLQGNLQQVLLAVKYGRVRLAVLDLAPVLPLRPNRVESLLDGRAVPCSIEAPGTGDIRVRFADPLTIRTGATLDVRLTSRSR